MRGNVAIASGDEQLSVGRSQTLCNYKTQLLATFPSSFDIKSFNNLTKHFLPTFAKTIAQRANRDN